MLKGCIARCYLNEPDVLITTSQHVNTNFPEGFECTKRNMYMDGYYKS